MPTTKSKAPKTVKKQPAQVGGGDYSKILNPATGKHVQAGGSVGKKLIKNYRYGTIVNPATGKAVKTGGKVGGEVLRNYQVKVGGFYRPKTPMRLPTDGDIRKLEELIYKKYIEIHKKYKEEYNKYKDKYVKITTNNKIPNLKPIPKPIPKLNDIEFHEPVRIIDMYDLKPIITELEENLGEFVDIISELEQQYPS